MSFPNTGAIADEISNLFGVKPESIADLIDVVLGSMYSKVMKVKYPHDGYDSITGEYDSTKIEICDCQQKQFRTYGRSGFRLCPQCKGSGVKGGWKTETFRGFFWNGIPSGLKNFGQFDSLTLPIDRIDATVRISANEDKRKFKHGNFILVNMSDIGEEENWVELEIRNLRPIHIGYKVVWRWIILTRQPVDQTG